MRLELPIHLPPRRAGRRRLQSARGPDAYDGIDAVITRDRRGGLRGVELTRCDEQRSDSLEARRAIDDFEEVARRSGVPPGWPR